MEKLGQYVNIRTGKLDANAADENGKYPFFTCAVEPLKINIEAYDCECVLVAGNGDLNVKYYKGKFNAYQRTYIIESKDKKELSIKFLYRFIDKSLRQLRAQTRGGVIQYLRLSDLTELKFKLPSIEDQIHIANLLSKAEELISQRKESIRLLDEFLKSTFLEMFSKKRYKKEKLGSVMEIISGQVDPREDPYKNMYHVGGANIESNTGKIINLQIAGEINLISGKYFFTRNCILYSKIRPYLNKVALPDFDGICSADIYPIIPKENINKLFLRYLLTSNDFLSYTAKHSDRTSIPKINREALLNWKMILPELEEQNKFAQIVEKTESLKAQYQSSLKELENLYGSLSQRAFKGELSKTKQEEKVLMIADKIETSQKGKVIELELRKCDSSEKAILAGHIINSTNSEDFGRVKFQKLLYLTEHFCKLELGSSYMQKAAGPYDGTLIREIESTLKRFRFYDINQLGLTENNRVNYTPLSSASELDILFEQNFEAESKKIDAFLEKFKNSTWEQCEIIATLYAVWNNRIIRQEPITDELLKQDFLNWNKQKIKYKDRLDNALKWMRKEAVIPDGWGKLVQIENKI